MTIDLQGRFTAAHAASRAEPHADADARRAMLATLRDLVRGEHAALADAIDRDFGCRAREETELLERVPLLNAIRHARRSLRGWMRDEPRRVALTFQPARAWVRHEPLGVVGVIAPWNYPLLLALAPAVDALAAGNRVLIKPSELTPAFSALLADLVAARFDPAWLTVIPGGVDTAKAFAALPFDHLVFTGSTGVGRQVMRAAADSLTPVTLELGGKSPAIVAPDYPLARAARSIAFGKFVNAGQTCIAPDYVLAPAASARALAQAVAQEAVRAYPTIQDNAQYSNIIDEKHRARLRAAIDEARAAGATILTHPDDAGGNGKIAPTIVLDPPHDGALMRDEIFGPALPIVPYATLDDAIAFAAARPRPLALYAFTRDRRALKRILDGAPSGGVTVNGTLMHIAQDDLPFGGVGPSGTGAYHGHDGFRRLSHARSVHRIGFVNTFEALGPPWGVAAKVVGRALTAL